MNIQENFIPYEQALSLKKLGFNQECFAMFMKDSLKEKSYCSLETISDHSLFTPAPTYQQAFEWFLKEKKLFGVVYIYESSEKIVYDFVIKKMEEIFGLTEIPKKPENLSYDEAKLKCLISLIYLVESNTKS